MPSPWMCAGAANVCQLFAFATLPVPTWSSSSSCSCKLYSKRLQKEVNQMGLAKQNCMYHASFPPFCAKCCSVSLEHKSTKYTACMCEALGDCNPSPPCVILCKKKHPERTGVLTEIKLESAIAIPHSHPPHQCSRAWLLSVCMYVHMCTHACTCACTKTSGLYFLTEFQMQSL